MSVQDSFQLKISGVATSNSPIFAIFLEERQNLITTNERKLVKS